jgi:hypothetical protein
MVLCNNCTNARIPSGCIGFIQIDLTETDKKTFWSRNRSYNILFRAKSRVKKATKTVAIVLTLT